MKPYSAIIFDLGGVIMNLSIEKTIESFKKKMPGFFEDQFCGRVDQHEVFNRYETGKTDTQTFYRECLALYQSDLEFQSFRESWNAMILDVPVLRIELLKNLKSRGTRIFLLSNINALHAESVEESFRSYFEKAYYSFEMGLRKPDPQIFVQVLRENGLKATDTLFIDDGLHHVESAKTLGLQTIHLLKGQTIDKLSL